MRDIGQEILDGAEEINGNNEAIYMTPCEILFLIHCHVSPGPHPQIDAPVYGTIIPRFLNHDLIKKYGDQKNEYITTDRGIAHVSQLCSTPWPVQIWADEQGRPIKL